MEGNMLGTTSLGISKIGFGCMSLTPEKEAEGRRAVCGAVEAGINFFDTADVYASGESERILGRALHDCSVSRDDVVIATKCSIVFPGMVPQYTYKAYDASENYIRAACEQYLKRLNTDYIDLFQVHRIDYLTHPEETAQALEKLQREGKIRHAGVSNYSLPEIRALATYICLESLQTPFSLLNLEPLEVGYQAICLEKSMTLLAYSPLARAALTGTKEFPHSDWQGQRDAGVVVQLRRFADEYNLTVGQLSLAWLLQMPGGVIPLVGTANDAHIREAAAAAEVTLARDDWYEMLVIGRGRPMPWRQKPYFYLKDK